MLLCIGDRNRKGNAVLRSKSKILQKCLLYAINGGVDAKSKEQVGPAYRPITSEYLDYDEVMEKYDVMMDWLAGLYVKYIKSYSIYA